MEIRKRILIIFLLIIIDFSKSEKLSELENEKRSANCGKLALPKPKANGVITITDKAWLVRVHNKKPFAIQTYDSLGSFISPRHVITSAQPIIDKEKKWSKDGVQWDGKCTNGTNDLMVPEVYVKNLEIRSEACRMAKCVEKVYQAVKAWLLNICKRSQFDRTFVMMIVEVQRTDIQFACLADSLITHKEKDTCYAYGIKYEEYKNPASKSQLDYRLETINSYSPDCVLLVKYPNPGDRGGPLVMEFDGKQTIIGIGATPGYDDRGSDTYFFDVQKFQESICFTSGICEVQKTTTISTTATTSSQTSDTTSSESPTTSESTITVVTSEVTNAPRQGKRTKEPKVTPLWDEENENDEDDEEGESETSDEEYEDENEKGNGGEKKEMTWELVAMTLGILILWLERIE